MFSEARATCTCNFQLFSGFGPALIKNVSTLSNGISPRPPFLLTLFSVLVVFDFIYGLG